MKQNAYIAGVGMTPFGIHAARGLKALAGEAIMLALADAGIEPQTLEAAYLGNTTAALLDGQLGVTGQTVLRALGIGGIAVVNVENADATGATAFNQACSMVSLGAYDVVLACGFDRLHHADLRRSYGAMGRAIDGEQAERVTRAMRDELVAAGWAPATGVGEHCSAFMDFYAVWAVRHMQAYGTTREQFAAVAVKNAAQGALNPRAQNREHLTPALVLAAPLVAGPLTETMCAPIADGAAAVVIVSPRKARELGLRKPVRVLSSVLASGWDYQDDDDIRVPERVAQQVFEEAAVGPQDLHCIELHDATAACEILYYEHLGLCAPGEGGALADSGATALGGRIPVNPSGGLLRRGHATAATGLAQIVELTEQLRGDAGARQVTAARLALAHSGGGYVSQDIAAIAISILEA